MANSRRTLARVDRSRSRSALTRAEATSARPVSAGDDAPASTRRCRRGVSLSIAATCVEDLDSTLRAKHVEEGDRSFGQNLQTNRLALDRRRLDTRFACCNAGFPLAEPFEGLANLQCGFRRFRAPKPARTEGIVLLVGYFRVEQGSGLNALTGRNPHVPLGHGETRVGSKRARKRIPHRKGLRMRNAHEARAGQKCHRARKTHGCFAKHESYQSDRSRARALRKGAQVRRLGGGVSSPG